jgi:23S rRNA (uracil1939-C5)-methyltransferase
LTNSETALNAPVPGTELELDFTDLLANGQAVARASGLVVFCFGPLPGERARVRVTSRKATYAVADVVERLTSAADRAEPFCPVFGECGGCQVQHLAYASQLTWKRETVRNAVQRIGGIAGADVKETIGSANARAYRNKMSLVVEQRDGGAVVGFYRARSHDVVPIDGCPIVHDQLGAYVKKLAHAKPDDPLAVVTREARHVVARHAEEGPAVVAVTTTRRSQALADAADAVLRALPGVTGLVNSYEPRTPNAVLGRDDRVVAGVAEIEERIGGLRYRVSPASFFQVNVEIVARIFDAIERDVLPAHNVVDLYCGMGTFSLFFAQNGARVTGVEENRRAVDEARENATRNALADATTFHAERVEHWVRSPAGTAALAASDVVFLDPPRKGSDEPTLRAIAAARVARIAYLSCDPATLARDLRPLVANGYALRSVQPFDMFPQTGHVEALALLTKENDG